jgi:hypothetical protein
VSALAIMRLSSVAEVSRGSGFAHNVIRQLGTRPCREAVNDIGVAKARYVEL